MSLPAPARAIIESAAVLHGVGVEDVLGESRMLQVAKARRRAARDLRRQGWSYSAIAKALNRDHSTIWTLLRNPPSAGRATRVDRACGVVESVQRDLRHVGLGHLSDALDPVLETLRADSRSRAAGDYQEDHGL